MRYYLTCKLRSNLIHVMVELFKSYLICNEVTTKIHHLTHSHSRQLMVAASKSQCQTYYFQSQISSSSNKLITLSCNTRLISSCPPQHLATGDLEDNILPTGTWKQ
jgi:hypothetical protein